MQRLLLLSVNFLLVYFLFSCSQNEGIATKCDFKYLDSLKLLKYKEFEIDIDSTMSVYPKSIQVFSDKNRRKSIIVFDEISDQISFFDLSDLNLVRQIKILRDGPNGIGAAKITGIQVYQEDSIWVASAQKIHLINSRGESFDQIDFVRNTFDVSGMPFITSEQPTHFDGTHLFVSIYPDRSSFELKNFSESAMKTFAKVN
jgi:hypothetical protein